MSNPNLLRPRSITLRMRPAWWLLGLVALLLSACTMPSPVGVVSSATPPSPGVDPTSKGGSTATPTGLPDLPEDDYLVEVLSALRAEYAAMPFRIYSTIDSGTTQVKNITEVESARRILLVTVSGSVKIVDGMCFQKPDGGVWRDCDSPSMADGISSMFDPAFIDANLAMIQPYTVRLVAKEKNSDNILCRIYEYKVAGDSFGVHTEGTVRLWVDDSDNLPLKLVTTSVTAGYSATTTQEIQYDPTITVGAP